MATAVIALEFILALASTAFLPSAPAAGLSARWLGQIGTDRVGRSPKAGPNGVQDMVIELAGLPVGETISRVTVRGHGGDEWGYQSPGGHWAAELSRQPGSNRALVSIEPSRVETGRAMHIEVEFAGGRIERTRLEGGQANPLVRMPAVQLAARWHGPDGSDHVSPGPSVGPDGLQDMRIDLARLDPGSEITELVLRAEGGPSWVFGTNLEGHHDALVLRSEDDRTRASLYFCATPTLGGRRLRIDLSYDNGTRDRCVIGAGTPPTDLVVDRPPLPRLEVESSPVRWLGQQDSGPLGPGAVRIAVDRPTKERIPRLVVLSDRVSGSWVFERSDSGLEEDREPPIPFVGESRRPLKVDEDHDRPGTWLLTFVPYRDLEGEELTLRWLDDEGRSAILRFPGQATDSLLRVRDSDPRVVRVEPGDDLHSAAEQGGTLQLSSGIYRLDAPLDLPEPITIVAEPGAELRFRQRSGDNPWGEAIAIRGTGQTRLSGLRIRFDGPVRWHPQAAWGGAIIGVPNLGKRAKKPLHIEVTGLDLEAPPASTDWEPAPNCLRLIDTDSGLIKDCVLKGGAIELFNGPWRIEGNRHRGTQPGTFAASFLSGHLSRDLEVIDNEIRPEAGTGKLYRFLVLTDRGLGVTVRGNSVVGVGPMDDDERPHPNAPEVLLTESYLLRFEGRHAGLSNNGLVLAIPEPQGTHPEVGEVVSVLSGPDAGRWAVIDQVLDRNLLLLDRPMPSGDYVVSITPGFVNTVIDRNTIDCRGSTQAHNIVLTGNHYGTKVTENTLLGGSNAFRLSAYATGQPVHYGWSHTPQLDLLVQANTVIDSDRGGLIAVHHGPGQKSNRDRVYLTGSVSGNTFRWTSDRTASADGDRVALTIGQTPSIDPGELRLQIGRNQALGAEGEPVRDPMRVLVGTINDRTYSPPLD